MRHKIATAILILTPSVLMADSLTFSQVKHELDSESVLPLFGNVDVQLSKNLILAQSQASYASDLSLDLSIQAVLRAISLYVWDGGPASITSEANQPIVWAQSRVAIDPSLSVDLNPSALNLGTAQAVPEPDALLYLVGTLGLGVILSSVKWSVKRRTRVS